MISNDQLNSQILTYSDWSISIDILMSMSSERFHHWKPLIGADAENKSQTLGGAQGMLWKKGRKDCSSKRGVKATVRK